MVVPAYWVLNLCRSVQDRTFDHFLGYMCPKDGDEHWSLPPLNGIKISSDVAIFGESNCYSYSFVVRDHKGNLVKARSKYLRGSPSPDLTEVIGIREALSWIKNGDHCNIVVKSDCLQIVQAICSSFMSYLGRVIKECRSLLASLNNKNVKFKFVKWSANKVDHFLA